MNKEEEMARAILSGDLDIIDAICQEPESQPLTAEEVEEYYEAKDD